MLYKEPQESCAVNNVSGPENLDELQATQKSTLLPIHMLRHPRLNSMFSAADVAQLGSNHATKIDSIGVHCGAASSDANGYSRTNQIKGTNDISTGLNTVPVLTSSSKKENLLDHGDRSNMNDLKFLGSSLGVRYLKLYIFCMCKNLNIIFDWRMII